MMTKQQFRDSLTDLEKGLFDFYMQLAPLKMARNVLEIGSGWGIFTRSCMETSPDIIVTTIDKISSPKSFKKNTEGFEKRIFKIDGDSKEVMKDFGDKTFDVVMIDGDHGYEGFKSDLLEAERVLVDESFLIIDDVLHENNWEGDYGITKALSEFLLERRMNLKVVGVGHGVGILFN